MEPMTAKVLLKVGDNITTDHIMPSHASLLPYRSNIPHLAKYCFSGVDASFAERAMAEGGGIIIAGSNYGQGSSREHAALAPLYLGIKAVIAQSFARIHRANLINFGILPLLLADSSAYHLISQGHQLTIEHLRQQLQAGTLITAINNTTGQSIELKLEATDREQEIILAGGLLNYTKQIGGLQDA
jgi:aconitate hydratase